jgi:hypothetical protein
MFRPIDRVFSANRCGRVVTDHLIAKLFGCLDVGDRPRKAEGLDTRKSKETPPPSIAERSSFASLTISVLFMGLSGRREPWGGGTGRRIPAIAVALDQALDVSR